MAERTRLTPIETVREAGSWLFTVTDPSGDEAEYALVPCEDGVAAWRNRCTHQSQRFDTGRGVPIREGQIVCPRHGSLFDACSGRCDNGEAAGTALQEIKVSVEDGDVYLVDDEFEFSHEGGLDDDDGPSSTSHIGF